MTDSTDPPSSKYEGTTISIEQSLSKDEQTTDYTDPPSYKYEGTTITTELSLFKDEGTTDYTDLPSYEGTTVSTEQSPLSTTDSTDLPSSKYEGTTISIEKSPSKDESSTDPHSSKYEGSIFSAVPKVRYWSEGILKELVPLLYSHQNGQFLYIHIHYNITNIRQLMSHSSIFNQVQINYMFDNGGIIGFKITMNQIKMSITWK